MDKTNEILLRAEQLKKSYGSGQSLTKALDDVSLEIHTGELLVILGSSGCGKSTLLNMIGGMDVPDHGRVIFDGQNVTAMKEPDRTAYRKNNIGFVFQSFNLIAELTVRENVALTAETKANPEIVDQFIYLIDIHKIAERGMIALAKGYVKEKGFTADKAVYEKLKGSLASMEAGNIDRFVEFLDNAMKRCENREKMDGITGKNEILPQDI